MKRKRGRDEAPAPKRAPLLNLQEDRCRGCTHCLRVCPTEAIRIRKGKAEVMAHRCIQCGECIRACPNGAWEVFSDCSMSGKVGVSTMAVLDPTVFCQLGNSISPSRVAQSFVQIGFSMVEDMEEALEIYRGEVLAFLASPERPIPAISSTCPAVVQLIQVKFPSLLENLVPILPPWEIAVSRIRRANPSATHIFYIVPCLARAQAATETQSAEGRFQGAIPLSEVYNPLKAVLHGKREISPDGPGEPTRIGGMEWAAPWGESRALGMEVSLVVDGIHRVADLLELVENGLLGEVPFVEAWACPGGCLGGPWNVQNPYLARFHMLSWVQKNPGPKEGSHPGESSPSPGLYRQPQPLLPRAGMRLDENLTVAMKKLRRIDELAKKFPGIDCGSCGCPNCLALAEDIVQGRARVKDCLYLGKRETSKEGVKRRKGGPGCP